MTELFLGFDLGSSGAKVSLRDREGKVLFRKAMAYRTESPEEGWFEQSPEEDWWQAFKSALSLISNEGIDLSGIRAIGCTGYVPALCGIDSRGRVLRNSIMHTDLRGKNQLKQINSIVSPPTGMGAVLPKLLWLRNEEPEIFSRIDKILNPHSYIVYRLTGTVSCDRDSAYLFGGPWFIQTGRASKAPEWNRKRVEEMGINPEILPPVAAADSSAGTILPEIAGETGLSPETIVTAGTGDSFTAMLGFGLTDPGDFMIYLGSSATQIILNTPIQDLTGGPHFDGTNASFTGKILSCGDTFSIFTETWGIGDLTELDRMAEKASISPNSAVWIPHKKQKEMDSDEKNREAFLGITEHSTPGQAFLTLLEGIAFNIRTNFEPVRNRAEKVFIGGGGACSSIFLRTLSNILNTEIHIPDSPGSSDGAALLARLSYSDGMTEEAFKKWNPPSRTLFPDRNKTEYYNRKFQTWLNIRALTEKAFSLLDNSQKED